MIVGKEYIVLCDGIVKLRGTFRECQKYCRDIYWAHDLYKEIMVVRLVANGKEI